MNKGSRLSGLGSSISRPAHRLKSSGYSLQVTMVSPDQVKIDLWKGDKFIEMVAEVDPADLDESAFDFAGRLKPSVIWGALQTAKQYMQETRGIVPDVPAKHTIYQADYLGVGRHPNADD